MSTIAATWMLTVLVIALLEFVTGIGDHFSQSVLITWAILAPALIGLGRMCLRIVQHGLLRQGIGARRVAIAGQNQLGWQTSQNIMNQPGLGLRFVGFFDDRSDHREQAEELFPDGEANQPELTGTLGQLRVVRPSRRDRRDSDHDADASRGADSRSCLTSSATRPLRSTSFPTFLFSNCSIPDGPASAGCLPSVCLRIPCSASMASPNEPPI